MAMRDCENTTTWHNQRMQTNNWSTLSTHWYWIKTYNHISWHSVQSLSVQCKLHSTWWSTHYSVNTFCHWSQYSWSWSMCMHKKVWLFHGEKPHRILQDLWRSSEICWGSLKIQIFQESFKDPWICRDPKWKYYKDLITLKYKQLARSKTAFIGQPTSHIHIY